MKNIGSTLLAASAVVSSVSAFVIPSQSGSIASGSSTIIERQAQSGPAAQLLSIAPTSNDCSNAQPEFRFECITSADAVQPIITGFAKYKVATAPEQAALLAWMAFESGDFKFNKHHFPGPNPGQGTRNMMSPGFVLEYAAELGVAGSAEGALDTINADVMNSFGSAAWFYVRKCSEDVKGAVRSGSQAGFEAFTTACVGTTVTPARLAYWERAMAALGVPR